MDYLGRKVLIVEDCRPGGDGAGETGIITAFKVILFHPTADLPGDIYQTPVIPLDNGDLIYGTECWWEYAENVESLEEA